MKIQFTRKIKASKNDEVRKDAAIVINNVKNALFDKEDEPQPADNGAEHGLEFITWSGGKHSFIVTHNGKDYRISVKPENVQ